MADDYPVKTIDILRQIGFQPAPNKLYDLTFQLGKTELTATELLTLN